MKQSQAKPGISYNMKTSSRSPRELSCTKFQVIRMDGHNNCIKVSHSERNLGWQSS